MNQHENIEIGIINILREINLKYGYDLSGYSKSFVRRRFMNRMNLSGLGSLEEMRQLLINDPQFFAVVLLDISINVTEMFRDPSFFLTLRREVLPYLTTFPFIKIWDAGCATGEELYSLAIVLKEHDLYDRTRIYATDINDSALQTARSGIYPVSHMKVYTANYQKAGGTESFAEYYRADGEYAIFDHSLKENIVFANHNLVTDGVFNEMHLVLCRNVMIYFNRTLQNRVFKLFRDALCYNGFLCLGAKETLKFSEFADDFEESSVMRERIFRKVLPTERRPQSCTGEKQFLPDTGSQAAGSGKRLFEVVVIGVSTGGLKALTRILGSLGDDFPLSIIIVQHQYPSSSDYLANFLDKNSPLKVKEAEDKEMILLGTVYIAPPSYHLAIEDDGTFSLSLFERVRYARPSVDVLFESAAEVYRERLIGVILTGGNNDGSHGLKMVKERGGFTMVEDPGTAEVSAMPKAALAATEVDAVLPLERIGPFLKKLGQRLGNDIYCEWN